MLNFNSPTKLIYLTDLQINNDITFTSLNVNLY